MIRRQLVASFAVLGAGLLSGCIESIYSQENSSRVCDISFLNRYTESIEIQTKVTEGGDTITENERVENLDDDSGQMYSIPESDLPTGPGEYHIEIEISGEEWEIADDVHTTDFEANNLSLVWAISNPAENGTTPTVQLLTNQDGDEC